MSHAIGPIVGLSTVAIAAVPLTLAGLVASDADAVSHAVTVYSYGYTDSDTGQPITFAQVGDVVTWTWIAGPHSVSAGAAGTSLGLPFDSGIQGAGFTYTVAFNTPGAFPYACRLHLPMNGLVVVTPS